MGKFTRLGAVMTAAASMVLAPMAMAAPTAPYPDDADWDWNGLETIDGNYQIFRAAGRDRIETAIQLMCHATDKVWKGVIIARSDDYADALTSGPLADVKDYALLIMPSGVVDARVISAINANCNSWTQHNQEYRTNIRNIILIGGTGVWTEAQRQQIRTATHRPVGRIAGIDRYDTAVEIAEEVADYIWSNGWGQNGPHTPWSVNAYVATGTNFPDALAAGAAAAANDGVVLLTKGEEMDSRGRTVGFLDKEYEWMPNRIGHIEIHTVGGPADAALRGADVRIDFSHVGANRYATAVKLAQTYAQDADSYTIASGENYPDGVVAGAFAANHDGPLLLTRNAYLSPETRDYLRLESDLHTPVMVVGGIGSVSRAVSDQVWDALHY